MISTSTTRNSLASYLTAQATATADSGTPSANLVTGTATKTRTAAATQAAQAALQVAASKPKAASAEQALDKQQATLAADLRTALGKAGVKLSGTVEFSVDGHGKVDIKATAADKAATTAFLRADTSKPGFAARIATQARDALKLSNSLQQTAAISQATRYAGGVGKVMSMYTSLMQQTGTTPAVFSLGASSSSLSYAGSLTMKA